MGLVHRFRSYLLEEEFEMKMYKEAINRGMDCNLFIIEDKATNSYQN